MMSRITMDNENTATDAVREHIKKVAHINDASGTNDNINNRAGDAPYNFSTMSENYMNTTDSTVTSVDYTRNLPEIKNVSQKDDNVLCTDIASGITDRATFQMLKLFASQPRCIAQKTNTSFSTEPTAITDQNADDFFKFDHTPIRFTNGHSLGANFEFATAIPFDMDNSHSDNPNEWTHPEKMDTWLQERGLNYWIAASRNNWLPKDGKEPRPKFHV